jgi:lactaldehyde dehydrogenase/glycolaldehyde dehydrogenase
MTVAVAPPQTRMRIGDSWREGSDGITRPVINSATGDPFAEVAEASAADAQDALAAAAQAQPSWRRRTGPERAGFLLRIAALIRRDAEPLARLVVGEQGKPLALARGEVDFAARFFEYFASFARGVTGEIMASENRDQDVLIRTAPHGVVVGLTAWNFPAALFARKVAPAIMAGNCIVVKPHEDTPLTALALAALTQEAELPPGVVNVVCGAGRTVGEALVRHPITRLVSLTGSVRAGREIARAAAEDLTVVSLELGGKAPFIVLDDADVDAAVAAAVAARFANCGQVCTSNERTYVHERIADRFVRQYVAQASQLRLGDPMEPGTDLGPKVNQIELEKVERLVSGAEQDGARVALGGSRPPGERFTRGYWYQPTVLTGVHHEMPIMREEVFGPVALIMPFQDLDQAVTLANDTSYGLSAYVYSNDLRATMRLVDELRCGEVYVNNVGPEQVQGYHSGLGLSGYGGDDGVHGLERYLQRKTVYLSYGDDG